MGAIITLQLSSSSATPCHLPTRCSPHNSQTKHFHSKHTQLSDSKTRDRFLVSCRSNTKAAQSLLMTSKILRSSLSEAQGGALNFPTFRHQTTHSRWPTSQIFSNKTSDSRTQALPSLEIFSPWEQKWRMVTLKPWRERETKRREKQREGRCKWGRSGYRSLLILLFSSSNLLSGFNLLLLSSSSLLRKRHSRSSHLQLKL